MKDNHLISPISLDLGAAKTGVFHAIYPSGISLADLSELGSRSAYVADIPERGYTLLQTGRTANRHARRGHTRNRQAKKLLLQVLQHVYQFPANKYHEGISHLMNRRGFTYVESQVDLDKLDSIPDECQAELIALLEEKGQTAVAALFEQSELSDALNEMAYHHTSDLELTKLNVAEWCAADKKRGKDLKPLMVALDFYIKELTAGSKYRAKYFSAIKKDINLMRRHPVKACRKLFFALQDHSKRRNQDMVHQFYQLLCHINNFDRKLLNAIHRKIDGQTDATLIEATVSGLFGKWICKQWAMSKANGAARLTEIRALQQNWKQFAQQSPDKVFDFFIATEPRLTIPPYESHTNRHPPRCQTLTLNPDELDVTYPEWKNWLQLLKESDSTNKQLNDYQEKLSQVVSGKGNLLITEQELFARQLQLVLDTSKSRDLLRLNEIWSQFKKRKALKRQNADLSKPDANLDKLLTQTKLPVSLHPDFHHEPARGSFWHLVNRYYQTRRRARDGRYFLFYDRTKPEAQRWQRDGNLLMTCTHRPRQLRHQALTDIAGLLGVGKSQLPEDMNLLQGQFFRVRGLKSVCEKAYSAQKRHGADLKQLLHTDSELIKENAKVPALIKQLAVQLALTEELQATFCERNQSFYVLAQLYPLVWGDRSGFGKTCPVCAQDNAVRMSDSNNQPQASRLSTLSMRLIDGALKRLLTHQAHHIANRIWPEIERRAQGIKKVTVPLILEQNRFDFTENLPALKGLPAAKKPAKTLDLKGKKNERIQQASKGVCPYTGATLTENSGDIDHIIPRSGRYGVLNDEANLIFASATGNRTVKRDSILTLADLAPAYLKRQFGTDDIQAITQQIEHQLWAEDKERFAFGHYRQFIALDEATQVAFRHALFLAAEHPLRAMVLDAMGHRHKAKVNGTQRYMAQLLADIFTAKAKGTALQGTLEFDYFEVSSNGLDEDSTVALRRLIRTSTVSPELDLTKFDKQPGKTQHDYSHVIDATMAFLIALEKHQGEGALQLNLAEHETVWGELDENGVLTAKVFEKIAVDPQQLAEPVKVVPRSSFDNTLKLQQGAKSHEAFSRPIFRQNAIGLEFYDLSILDGKVYKGYMLPEGDSSLFKVANAKPADKQLDMLQWAHNNSFYRLQQHGEQAVYHPNKQKLTELLFNTLNAAKNRGSFDTEEDPTKLALWLFGKPGGAGLMYFYSTNASMTEAPAIVKKQTDSPYYNQWLQHYEQWLKIAPDTKVDKGVWIIAPEQLAAWHKHCRQYLDIPVTDQAHKPVRSYGMRAITTGSGAMALVRRYTAGGDALYQLQAFDNATLSADEIPAFALSSPNVALLKKERITKGYPTQLTAKKTFEPQIIPVQTFFKADAVQELGLPDGIEVFAAKPTQAEVRNIPVDWFMKHLLQPGDGGKSWKEQKTLAISKQADADDTVNQDQLQRLLARGCKSDKRAGAAVVGDTLVLSIPYASASLSKLLAE